MIGSIASGATASLVAKNVTKKLSQLFEDRFWCSRCLSNHIEVPNMIGSIASGTTAFLVAKNGTKQYSQLFEDRFYYLRCLNDRIEVPNMIGSFASGANAFMVAKLGTKDLSTSCSVYRIWNNGWILTFKVPIQLYCSPWHDHTWSFKSGTTTSLVAKNGNKQLSQPFEDGFWC